MARISGISVTTVSISEAQVLDGVTPGTVTASKALVVDSNKDLASLRDVTLRNLTPTGGINAGGGFTAAPRCWHSGGNPASLSTDGTDTTPSTTETYFAEVWIPANTTLTGAAVFNGSAVGTDKLIAILWDSTGAALANSALAGTTAVGTDAYQLLPFTATYAAKGPATYYVGIQVNGTTYRFNTHVLGVFGADKKTSTVFGTVPSITPPTAFVTGRGPIITLY